MQARAAERGGGGGLEAVATPHTHTHTNKYFELKTRGAAAPTRNTCSLRSQLHHSQ